MKWSSVYLLIATLCLSLAAIQLFTNMLLRQELLCEKVKTKCCVEKMTHKQCQFNLGFFKCNKLEVKNEQNIRRPR